jgi:hypothetical protein
MTRFTKSSTGKYIVSGKSFEMLCGTRAQVWHGTAYKTSGGLTKSDILQNKNGRIVSRSKHASAKKEKRLVKAGYGTKKGKFGFVKLHGKSKKMRGGIGPSSSNSGSSSNNSNSNMPSNNSNSNMPSNNSNSSSNSSSNSANMAKIMMAQNQGNSGSNSNSNNSNSNSGPASMMNKGGRGSRHRKGKGKRGGGTVNFALSPSKYDGQGVQTSGNAVQFAAGMGN